MLSNSYCTVMNLTQSAATSLSGLILFLVNLQQVFKSSKGEYFMLQVYMYIIIKGTCI